MKKTILSLSILTLLSFGCSDDDGDNAPIIGGGTDEVCTINKSGFIETNETWNSECIYILNNKVVVPDGVTLTIEPGTII